MCGYNAALAALHRLDPAGAMRSAAALKRQPAGVR